MTKIQDLKENIDPNLKEDPIPRLKKSQINNKLSFKIKCTDEKDLKEVFKKLKKKKSAGYYGLTQAQLVAGAPTLTKPLVKIFNKSISEGQFPNAWKEAIVTPVLKKDATMS